MDNNENVIITGYSKHTVGSAVFLGLALWNLLLCLICVVFILLSLFSAEDEVGRIVGYGIYAVVGIVLFIVFKKVSKKMPKHQISVTDKRISGTCSSGKQVDLPLDSITAVAKSAFKTISISTSSGKISFDGLENSEQIYLEINNLLTNRQNIRNTPTVVNQQIGQSSADELKKFKDLLDIGVISQQ